MIALCEKHDIKLLTYGTLLGGFLSERYLGAPEPRKADLTTRSLSKYKRFIDDWGGWSLFQELLQLLKQLADKHKCSIPNVACKYILDKPCVGGVIVGCRLGLREHIADNARVFEVHLDAQEVADIEKVVKKGRPLPGDCGDEYRS